MHRTVLFVALMGMVAVAQDSGWSPTPSSGAKPKKGTAEKTCCEDGKAKPWAPYNKTVTWTQDIDAAFAKAKEAGKLLMVFHLVGDMDKEGC